MKKLIAILVAFVFVTGAVFAQEGSWSLGGKVEFGSWINFAADPLAELGEDHDDYRKFDATNDRRAYWDWDNSGGNLDINYNRGQLNTGVSLVTKGDSGSWFQFNGDNYQFRADGPFKALFEGWAYLDNGNPGGASQGWTGHLWGWYGFLDGKLHVEGAVRGRDTSFWHVGTYTLDKFLDNNFGSIADWRFSTNALVVDVKPIDGISFGFLVPGFWYNNDGDYLKDSFGRTAFGVKVAAIDNMEFALQFALSNMQFKDWHPGADDMISLLLSGKFSFNPITASILFKGDFGGEVKGWGPDPMKGYAWILGAAGVEFSSGPFGAALAFGLEMETHKDAGDVKPLISIFPKVTAQIVENYLGFQLEGHIKFQDKTLNWLAIPELQFNFLGTGAGPGYWWPMNTALFLRYNIGSTITDGEGPKDQFGNGQLGTHRLDLIFKWSF